MPTIRSSLSQAVSPLLDRAALSRAGVTRTNAASPTAAAQTLSPVTPLGGSTTRSLSPASVTLSPASVTLGSPSAQPSTPTIINKGHVYTPAERLAIQHIRPAQDQINEQMQRTDLNDNTKAELWQLKRWFERSARDAAVQANAGGQSSLESLNSSLTDLTAEFNRRLRELSRPASTDAPGISTPA